MNVDEYRWNGRLLAVCLLVLASGLVGSALAANLGDLRATLLSPIVLWIAMLVTVVIALKRGRPGGLLSFRPDDLLWAAVFGLLLRFADGLLSNANAQQFPQISGAAGIGEPYWWISEALPVAVVGPVLEEFVFRGVILVGLYQVLRRAVGAVTAAFASLLASSGMFALIHSVFSPQDFGTAAAILLVGVSCGSLVLMTGRLWGAVLTHSIYNLTYLLLALIGGSFQNAS